MSDVLVRDVHGDDLDLVRATAAGTGVSLQSYLRSTVQATYLRRQQTLAALDQRLIGTPVVEEEDRTAVLDALVGDQGGRAEDLRIHQGDDDQPSSDQQS